MRDEELGSLLGAFANYYWSIPVEMVVTKIAAWHPEVTLKQFKDILSDGNEHISKYHFYYLKDGLDEPEITIDHLISLDEKDFDRFVEARIDGDYADCDEETLLKFDREMYYPETPEKRAIIDFARKELGLDFDFARQLLFDCHFFPTLALCENKSWVMSLLQKESYGKIHFQTVEQVNKLRELGNAFYRVTFNPVLKCWRPCDIENAPVPKDDIPATDSDIPDNRSLFDDLIDSLGGREKLRKIMNDRFPGLIEEPAKIGRNDPCPCGSGKKYKKCCGANA